jgi:hypothetical protein
MRRRPWLWLAGLYAVLVLVTAVWVSIDRRPPEWDHANHLERALRCRDNLAGGRLQAVLEESAFYPPLALCAAGVLYFVFPVAAMTAQAVMLAFLAIAIAALFDLGRQLWDEASGVLVAFFFATAPFVVFSLMNFQLDLPLAAMVAVTLWGLRRTDGFRRGAACVGLGVVLGLGMLTKPTFPVYVAAPLLWTIAEGWRRSDRRRRLAWLGVALCIAAILALPWYGPRLIGMPFQVVDRSFKQAAEAEQAALFSAGWLLFYPRVFQPQFGLLAGLLCVWGLWAVRRDRGARAFVWLSVLPPLVVFSVIQNRNLRYTLPILPAAAVAAAAGVRALGPMWRRGIVLACLAVGALQVSMAAFALPHPPQLSLFLTPLVINQEPVRADWQHDRILDDLARASGGKPATVAIVPNYNFLSVSNLRYEALARGLPLQMTRAWSGPPLGVDFMVLKTGSQGPSFSAAKPEGIMRALGGADPDLATAFPVIAEYPLPDGSRAIVRARRIPPVDGVAPDDVARRLEQAREGALADFVRDAVGLRVSFDYRPEGILRGQIDRVRVEADAATIGELQRRDRAPLRVRDLRLEVDDLLINPQRLVHTGAIEVLDAGALRIERLTITQPDLDALLAGQPLGAWLAVRFDDGWADVQLKGFPGSARVGVVHGSPIAPLVIQAEDVRIGPIRVPDALIGWVVRNFDPTLRLRNLPVPISIAPIRIRPGRLEIGAEAKPS